MAGAQVSVATLTDQVPAKYRSYLPYLIPGTAVLIGILLVIVFLMPLIQEDLDLKNSVEQSGLKASAMDHKVQQLRSIDQSKLADNLAKAEAALPAEKDVAGFLANINQDTVASNTSIQNVTLTPVAISTVKGASNNNLLFQVAVQGDFPSVKNFLTKLETTRRVITVKTINLTSSSGQVLADMAIETYFLPDAKITPGSDTPLPPFTSAQDKILSDLDSRTNFVPPIPTPSSAGRLDPFSP